MSPPTNNWTTQKTKNMSHRPHQKNGDKLRFSRRVTGLYIIQLRPSVQGNIQICQPEGEVVFPEECPRQNNPPRVDKSGCFPTQRAVIALSYFCHCFIGYLPCGGKLGCSAGNNRVVFRQRKFWQSISIILLSHN